MIFNNPQAFHFTVFPSCSYIKLTDSKKCELGSQDSANICRQRTEPEASGSDDSWETFGGKTGDDAPGGCNAKTAEEAENGDESGISTQPDSLLGPEESCQKYRPENQTVRKCLLPPQPERETGL